MPLHPKNVESVVMAVCCLHNLIRVRYPSEHFRQLDVEDPESHEVTPGQWREGDNLEPLEPLVRNTSSASGKRLREYLKEYYNSPAGRVPWQDNMV